MTDGEARRTTETIVFVVMEIIDDGNTGEGERGVYGRRWCVVQRALDVRGVAGDASGCCAFLNQIA